MTEVEFIRKRGKAAIAALEYTNGDLDKAIAMLKDNYLGCYGSREEFVHELHEEQGNIPEYIKPHIDYHTLTRDLFTGTYVSVEDSDFNVHVFSV